MTKRAKNMRKSELRLNAEHATDFWGCHTIVFYKAMQYRWEDNETADPQIDYVSYHLTKSDAIEAAKKINLDLGFYPMVDKIAIEYDELNENIGFGEEFELSDLDKCRKFRSLNNETIWEGSKNDGKELDPEAIIVSYRHHRYMNYSYDITGVDFVKNSSFKTEADLRNDRDTTLSAYYITFDDVDDLANSFENNYFPFDKINSGSRIVREFLAENNHPDYSEAIEEED